MEKTKAAGNILPLSLIMMLIILMAGIGIGIVVLEGSRQSQSTDQSVTAYYMADSGVERQLYEVRKDNQSSDYVNGLSAPYFNGGRWVSTGALELPTSKTFDTIATSSFAVLDLFNPDDMTRTFNINTMNLIWTNDPSCGATPARVEVGYAYWTIVGGVPQFPSDNDFFILPKNNTGSMTVPLDPNKLYRIRIRSYDCSARSLKATFLNPSNAPVTYPGDLTLSAEGTYLKATQKIAVTMPKLDVLSGVFGYVIFSECQLLKGTGSPSCPP